MSCTADPLIYTGCASIFGIGGVCIVWFVSQYIKSRHEVESKAYFVTVLVFFILIATSCLSFAINNAFQCIYPPIANVFGWSARLAFIFQLALLLWLLFYRLTLIFKGSVFAISPCVKALFYVTYVSFIFVELVVVAVVSIRSVNLILKSIVIALGFFFALFYIIALVSLLVYKLIVVAKHASRIGGKDQSIASVITKVFILSLMSIIAIALVGLSSVVGSILPADTRLVQAPFITLNLCANFYSFFLGFQHFESYYTKTCGVCHRMCSKCCLKKVEMPLSPTLQHTGSTSGDTEIVVPSESGPNQVVMTIS